MALKNTRILFLLTSIGKIPASGRATGLWIEELAEPYLELKAHGCQMVFASIEGGQVPIDPDSWVPDGRQPDCIERFRNDDSAMHALSRSKTLDDLNSEEFDALYIPGGHGTLFDFPNEPRVARLVSDMLGLERPVVAICHGQAAFVGVRRESGKMLLDGLKITAFSPEEELFAGHGDALPYLLPEVFEQAGADYVCGTAFAECVVRDNLIISGQNPQSSKTAVNLLINILSIH